MNREKAQALLEVAIFGAIILMLLGVLITYGLRYNYQQQASQQAFRKALAKAVLKPGVSSSDVVISDKHIPSPSDTFGVGSVTPFTGSAGGIARDYLGDPPERWQFAPTVTLNINGREYTYTTAGFKQKYNLPVAEVSRYEVIYGSGNVDVTEGDCLEEQLGTNPSTGESEITGCLQPTKNLNIIDSCAGQIIDYGTAVKQCRMIVDQAACVKECSRNSSANCSSCYQPMDIPWYCETAECGLNPCNLGATHIYKFVKLENLFGSGGLKALGLQQDYKQNTLVDNTLMKTESAAGITTTEKVDWKIQTKRNILTVEPGSTSGVPKVENVTSEVSQNQVESPRTTDW
jgi:hypothetical protein